MTKLLVLHGEGSDMQGTIKEGNDPKQVAMVYWESAFKALTSKESGVFLRGEVRDAVVIKNENSNSLLVARNNAPMVIFDFGKIPQ